MGQKTEKIIAVDFDGTIVEHNFPNIGALKPYAKEVLNNWHDQGIEVIIWTCRNHIDPACGPEADVFSVYKFLVDNGIKFATINEHAPGLPFRLTSPKVFADMYIDDRNMGGFPGWLFTSKAVESFYKHKDWRNTHLEYSPDALFEKGQ